MNQPKRRPSWLPQIIFLILTFATAVSGTYVALRLFGDDGEERVLPEIITVEIIITATPAPTPLVDDSALAAEGAVDLPSDIAPAAAPAATVDANRIGAVDAVISAPTVSAGGDRLTDNCIFHTVVAGDTPYGIAQRYGADRKLLLEINGLTVESATGLQIGDVLRVPLDGCDFERTSRASSGNPEPTPLPAEVDLAIARAEAIGDITLEGIALRNDGERLNISGWILEDADGNRYTFPSLLLYAGSEILIYSRIGASTQGALFWGSDESLWSAGETATLTDAAGNIRKILRIPADSQ